MRLLVLMYHRASAGRLGNAAGMLDEHFAHIARNFSCVLPGERLAANRLNVCLSFDDGYFDFCAVVFPLLERHGLRALLAVSAAFIHERVELPAARRLQACADRNNAHTSRGGFCTWRELSEMASTGHVSIAAHGFTHSRLDRANADLHAEIVVPQTLLSARVGQPIESFVFPYGRFSSAALARVKQSYPYVFRIGGADNDGWKGRMLYRINADEMTTPDGLFAWPRLAAYSMRRYWNILRGR